MKKRLSRLLLSVQFLSLGLGLLAGMPAAQAASAIYITDNTFSRTYYDSNTIAAGDTLYFEAESSSANVNSGSIDTVTIIVKATSGDAEGRVLTETGNNTGIFRSSATGSTTATDALVTSGSSSPKGSGTLYILGSDTITATFFEVSASTVVDDLSTCYTTPPDGDTPAWLTLFGATGSCHSGYFESVLSAGPNPANIAGTNRQTSVIDYTARHLSFDFKVSNNNYLGQSNDLGGFDMVDGLSVVMMDSTSSNPSNPHQIKAEFTPYMTSVGSYVHVSIPESEFHFTNLGTATVSTQIDLTQIRLIYFAAITNGAAITTDITNLGYETGTTYTDTVGVSLAGNVDISATIDPTVSFTLDTTSCNFGSLTSATVKTCPITVSVSTNGTGGYSAYIYDVNNGTLNSASDNINSVVGTSLAAGTEGFGASTSKATQDLVQEASCADGASINAQAVTTSSQSLASATTPVDADSTVLCLAASITDLTAAGSYADTAYITVVGNF